MKALAQFALRRPYTFVVLAILILVYGIQAIFTTPTDVFPLIDIPVVAAVWSYIGLLPNDVSGRITYYYERAVTSTVENIEHIESDSYFGRNVVRVYFQDGTKIGKAEAEVDSISQTIVQQLPPDISPPMIMSLDASSVPVISLQVTAEDMTPAELYNLGITRLRPQLVTVPGTVVPHPYGGQSNTVLVTLDQTRLRSHKLSAMDVNNAFIEQSIVLPAGDQKIGTVDWMVQTNAVPQTMEEFNNIPIKQVGGAMVRLRDVAWVYQGGPPQTNVVLVDGKQAVMIVIMKGAEASTLDVVQGVKDLIPQMLQTVPPGVDIQVLTDASIFVKESVADVTRELGLATGLTGLVVLLFLGSWRSTIIITTSIPLSMLTSILLLHVTGQTINVMTLGGLALAVGILVDNGTVMIENIDSHIEHGKPLAVASVDAAGQMLLPTLVSTICICIVWLPLFQLSGVAGFLFMPMALAIIFAMIPSFILSQTLVPAMANWMLGGQIKAHKRRKENPNFRGGPFVRFQKGFDNAFLKFRNGYRVLLEIAVNNRKVFVPVFLAAALAAFLLIPYLGRDFFPEIKSGTLQMHMRAPIGTRIEVASRESKLVSDEMRRLLPGEVKDVLVNCGMPVGPHNMAFIPTPTLGAQDCDLTITLNNSQSPVWEFRDVLREGLREKFPGTVFTFQAAELTEKILNFGLPAPIDVRVSGIDLQDNYQFAKELREQIRYVTGAADVEIQQTMTTPTLFLDINRQYALRTGMKEADVAQNELMSLSGSQQVEQSYWLDPETGLSYLINIYTPQKLLTTMNSLETIPVTPGDGNPENKVPQLLGAMGNIRPVGTPGEVSHYNILPVIDIYATNEGRDLGAVAGDVEEIVAEYQDKLPQGSLMEIRGQFDTMNSAYGQLLFGLGLSILLVFLVIVVNFHSWLDPFIIITALPAALAGIVWALFVTGTTLSVPALTGTIMCMGTGTANSILVVAFARERLEAHGDAARAAIEAGYGRIRPVIMTALAMIVGMLPMSMSNSQNAPLGRAVIGGLILATIATLLFVPCMFAILHRDENRTAEGAEQEKEEAGPRHEVHGGLIALSAVLGLVLVVGAILIVVTGIRSRAQNVAELEEFTQNATVEPVAIIIPREGDPIREFDLPADVEAWYEAPIYARVNGYVKMWEKDFGAVVESGDVLATIDTPRLDAQYRAAKAKLDLANARLGLAELTSRRYNNLEGTQAVSKQQVDVQAANARMQQAEAEATAYRLAELEALESFRTVQAPFDGIVTSREVNVGDYVSELGGPLGIGGGATELFRVADVHKLRIFVRVPQGYIDMLKPGLTAEITVPQFPNETFHAEYLTDATALDTETRTATAELIMDNPNNHIWPGSYAEVHFHVPNDSQALLVPENSLIFQEFGTQLATVDENDHILIKDVVVGRNLGHDVEIISGIGPGERVITTPSASLSTGQSVRIVLPTPGYNVALGYNEDQVEAAIPSESEPGGKNAAEATSKTGL